MTAYRYWRVSNIVHLPRTKPFVTVGLLRFVNTEGIVSNVGANAFSSGTLSTTYSSDKAFTGTNSTFAENFVANNSRGFEFYIGYAFPTPVTVTKIGYQPRAMLATGDLNYEMWQRFLVEASSDNVNWVTIGECNPNRAGLDVSYREETITPVQATSPNQHRFWRIADVITRASYPNIATNWEVAGIRMLTLEKVESINPDNGFTFTFQQNYPPENVFRGDERVSPRSGSYPPTTNTTPWWLGYDFKYPVTVTAMMLVQIRRSVAVFDDWISACLQYSDDKVTWVTKGFFNVGTRKDMSREVPLYYSHDPQLIFVEATRKPAAPTKTTTLEMGSPTFKKKTKNPRLKTNIYTGATLVQGLDTYPYLPLMFDYALKDRIGFGIQGYIKGVTYERIGNTSRKQPVSRKVYLYHQGTGQLIAHTWSDENGVYLFTHLSLASDFMIVSVDHTGVWGLEGVVYKKAMRRVEDGLSIQYPISE